MLNLYIPKNRVKMLYRSFSSSIISLLLNSILFKFDLYLLKKKFILKRF